MGLEKHRRENFTFSFLSLKVESFLGLFYNLKDHLTKFDFNMSQIAISKLNISHRQR